MNDITKIDGAILTIGDPKDGIFVSIPARFNHDLKTPETAPIKNMILDNVSSVEFTVEDNITAFCLPVIPRARLTPGDRIIITADKATQ